MCRFWCYFALQSNYISLVLSFALDQTMTFAILLTSVMCKLLKPIKNAINRKSKKKKGAAATPKPMVSHHHIRQTSYKLILAWQFLYSMYSLSQKKNEHVLILLLLILWYDLCCIVFVYEFLVRLLFQFPNNLHFTVISVAETKASSLHCCWAVLRYCFKVHFVDIDAVVPSVDLEKVGNLGMSFLGNITFW